MNRVLIVSHRGASAYEPENTIRSFEKAFKLGADFVELDIRLSARKCRSLILPWTYSSVT